MSAIYRLCVLLLISVSTFALAQKVTSPDGRLEVTFAIQQGGVPTYSVNYGKRPVLLSSRLGFAPDFQAGFSVASSKVTQHSSTWKPVYGERSTIPDNYRELVVDLARKQGRPMRIHLRAYNEGMAVQYEFPGELKSPLVLGKELTEFRLPAGTQGYEEHGTEGEYKLVPVHTMAPRIERPLTLVYPDAKFFAAIIEAGTVEFPRMLLAPVDDKADALTVDQMGDAQLNGTSTTPWRLVLVGERPGTLLEHNYLVLNLNQPNAIQDTSWIKPGKAMREVTLSTVGAHAVIDFAAAHNLQYVLFDAGWYGSEDLERGDATTVRIHERITNGQPHAPLDLPEVIEYANKKSVGVVMYVDRRQIRKQRDILFPLYEKWGVKGVKIGFMDVGPQSETAWISETVRKAAEHHLLLDIHDQIRTTGYTRTYPNLLTMEGIRGNEHFPTAEHNATLPFTRYLAGSADYTVCYYDKRLKNTHAHQLAMTVISYSPMQLVFWYDRPAMYEGEPEVDWFEKVPTVWDDTRVLTDEIGKLAVIARRKGNDWFVGAVNGAEARQVNIDLGFLDKGKRYRATIYTDDPSVATKTHVRIETRDVTSSTRLSLAALSSGGAAIRISPAE